MSAPTREPEGASQDPAALGNGPASAGRDLARVEADLAAERLARLGAESNLEIRTAEARYLRRELDKATTELERLRSRRAVRWSLRLASLARPAFRMLRGTPPPAPAPAATSTVAPLRTAPPEPRAPAAAPAAPGEGWGAVNHTGVFYTVVLEAVAHRIPPDFAEVWSQGEAAPRPAHPGLLPLVSIIMATHNRAGIIGEAIATVLDQTYPHWELLVCDDASEDDTEAVVRGFGDDRIRYRRLPRGGAARARNAGLEDARGEFVAYLDSDNLWHPRFLETLVTELVDAPGLFGAYSRYLDVEVTPEARYIRDTGSLPFDYDRLAERNFIDLNTVVHRRRLYEHLGGFDERLARQQDWDLILKYSFLRDLHYVDRFLVLYQRNEAWDQITKVAKHITSGKALIAASVQSYYDGRLGAVTGRHRDVRLSVVSWDICRNHFSKAYNVAEALAPAMETRLVGFRFFDEPIFPPYASAEPAFATTYLPGGSFPGWSDSLARAVAAVAESDVVYAVKPRLPSLGVALLANYHFGTPVVVEANDLESVVTSPRPGQEAMTVDPSQVDPADPGLLDPYGPLWTAIMEHAATRVPLRVTHNSELDRHMGGGAYFLRNPKDESHFDPARHDRERIRRQLGFTRRDRVILFGGMVRRHKGVFELLELLDRAGSRYRLLVVGSRHTPDQKALARQAGDRVTIIDPVDRNEMAAVNLACDAAVLWLNPEVPASRYQMPYKLTDALAMRLPVIANDIGDLGDLGRRGYLRLVPFGDVPALAAELDRIFRDRKATEAMVDAGRRLYLRQFSYAAVRATMGMIVDDALARPGTLPVAAELAELLSAFLDRVGATAERR